MDKTAAFLESLQEELRKAEASMAALEGAILDENESEVKNGPKNQKVGHVLEHCNRNAREIPNRIKGVPFSRFSTRSRDPCSGRKTVTAQENSLGPGCYSPRFQLIEQRVVGGLMRPLRAVSPEGDVQPPVDGPPCKEDVGDDNDLPRSPNSELVHRRTGRGVLSFGISDKRERLSLVPTNNSPRLGPGTYDPMPGIARLVARVPSVFIAPIRHSVKLPRRARAVGPIGSIAASVGDVASLLGPGSYNPRPESTWASSRAATFGAGQSTTNLNSKRSLTDSVEASPGPGTYEAEDQFRRKRIAVVSMDRMPERTIEIAERQESFNPRSAAYIDVRVSVQYVRRKAPGVVFGKSMKSRFEFSEVSRKGTATKNVGFRSLTHTLVERSVTHTPIYRSLVSPAYKDVQRASVSVLQETPVMPIDIDVHKAEMFVRRSMPGFRYVAPTERTIAPSRMAKGHVGDYNPRIEFVKPSIVVPQLGSSKTPRFPATDSSNDRLGPGSYPASLSQSLKQRFPEPPSASFHQGAPRFSYERDRLLPEGDESISEGDVLRLAPDDTVLRKRVPVAKMYPGQDRIPDVASSAGADKVYDVDRGLKATKPSPPTPWIVPVATPVEKPKKGDRVDRFYDVQTSLVEPRARATSFQGGGHRLPDDDRSWVREGDVLNLDVRDPSARRHDALVPYDRQRASEPTIRHLPAADRVYDVDVNQLSTRAATKDVVFARAPRMPDVRKSAPDVGRYTPSYSQVEPDVTVRSMAVESGRWDVANKVERRRIEERPGDMLDLASDDRVWKERADKGLVQMARTVGRDLEGKSSPKPLRYVDAVYDADVSRVKPRILRPVNMSQGAVRFADKEAGEEIAQDPGRYHPHADAVMRSAPTADFLQGRRFEPPKEAAPGLGPEMSSSPRKPAHPAFVDFNRALGRAVKDDRSVPDRMYDPNLDAVRASAPAITMPGTQQPTVRRARRMEKDTVAVGAYTPSDSLVSKSTPAFSVPKEKRLVPKKPVGGDELDLDPEDVGRYSRTIGFDMDHMGRPSEDGEDDDRPFYDTKDPSAKRVPGFDMDLLASREADTEAEPDDRNYHPSFKLVDPTARVTNFGEASERGLDAEVDQDDFRDGDVLDLIANDDATRRRRAQSVDWSRMTSRWTEDEADDRLDLDVNISAVKPKSRSVDFGAAQERDGGSKGSDDERDYEPSYTAVRPAVQGFDMDKLSERWPTEVTRSTEIEGDILDLEDTTDGGTRLRHSRAPAFDMGKPPDAAASATDERDYNPRFSLVEKVQPSADFTNPTGREDQRRDDELEGEIGDYDTARASAAVLPRVTGTPAMATMTGRTPAEPEADDQDLPLPPPIQLDPNFEVGKKSVRTHGFGKLVSRDVPVPGSKTEYFFATTDYEPSHRLVKPRVSAPDFSSVTWREEGEEDRDERDYAVSFALQDKHEKGAVAMAKHSARPLKGLAKSLEYEDSELHTDSVLFRKHVPTVDLARLTGRETKDDDNYADLDYEPNISAVRKSAPHPHVAYAKALGRDHGQEKESYFVSTDYDPDDQATRPRAVSYDFGKPTERESELPTSHFAETEYNPVDDIVRRRSKSFRIDKAGITGRDAGPKEESFFATTDYSPDHEAVLPAAPSATFLGAQERAHEVSSSGVYLTGRTSTEYAYAPKAETVLPRAPSAAFDVADSRSMRVSESGVFLPPPMETEFVYQPNAEHVLPTAPSYSIPTQGSEGPSAHAVTKAAEGSLVGPGTYQPNKDVVLPEPPTVTIGPAPQAEMSLPPLKKVSRVTFADERGDASHPLESVKVYLKGSRPKKLGPVRARKKISSSLGALHRGKGDTEDAIALQARKQRWQNRADVVSRLITDHEADVDVVSTCVDVTYYDSTGRPLRQESLQDFSPKAWRESLDVLSNLLTGGGDMPRPKVVRPAGSGAAAARSAQLADKDVSAHSQLSRTTDALAMVYSPRERERQEDAMLRKLKSRSQAKAGIQKPTSSDPDAPGAGANSG
eukprot:Rmarinus@m.9806